MRRILLEWVRERERGLFCAANLLQLFCFLRFIQSLLANYNGNAELVRLVDAAIPAPLALRPPWRLDRAFVPSHERVRAPLKTLTETESQLGLYLTKLKLLTKLKPIDT